MKHITNFTASRTVPNDRSSLAFGYPFETITKPAQSTNSSTVGLFDSEDM